MNKNIAIIIFILTFNCLSAQNLVPNPGFENYSATNDTNLINSVINQGSQNILSTPYSLNIRYDFFGRYCLNWLGTNNIEVLRNRCPDSLGHIMGVYHLSKYENENDTVNLTHSGSSSASILFSYNDYYYNALTIKLLDTLCEGCKYKISYYVYVTECSNIIFNNIGMIFNLPFNMWGVAMDEKSIAPYYLKYDKPLIQGKWQKIEFEYTARGDETGFGFGRYYSNIKVKPLKKKQPEYAMRIYLDDFSIEEIKEEEPSMQR